VDPAVLMAIYGKETSYGSFTGSFDLLDVLGSLAYDGRRRDLFETEFMSALKLLDAGFTRGHLRGSYAGATGLPQFMPSVVLRLRADGDGDGQADIWRNEPDALASIANYLREAGWKPGVPWGTAVRVPASLNRQAVRSTQEAPRCPAVFRRHSRPLSYAEWRALGVAAVSKALPDAETASLLELDGPGGPAYLITANYRAILEYNCSNSYAMSIGLLADAIARR
jgi:lytic murein transglycosylase